MTRHIFKAIDRQRGVSLIELMVGVTIGLLVVLAATGSVVLNRVSANTVTDTAALTSQGNNALRQMAYSLRSTAAFEVVPTDTSAAAAVQVFNLADPMSATVPVTVRGVDGDTGESDELTANFGNKAAAITRDCLGNTVAAVNQNIPNRYYIDGTNLMCQGIAGNAAQPMAQNVENFQVLYLTEDGAGWHWKTATEIVALGAATWNRVVAVEVCIQLRGEVDHGSALVGNYTNCDNAVTAHDDFYRVALRQTVQLRNRMNNL